MKVICGPWLLLQYSVWIYHAIMGLTGINLVKTLGGRKFHHIYFLWAIFQAGRISLLQIVNFFVGIEKTGIGAAGTTHFTYSLMVMNRICITQLKFPINMQPLWQFLNTSKISTNARWCYLVNADINLGSAPWYLAFLGRHYLTFTVCQQIFCKVLAFTHLTMCTLFLHSFSQF